MTASWWKETGWPWLKKNWWAVLIAPVALLVAVGIFAQRKLVVLDPVEKADRRAKEEAERRIRELQDAKLQLELELSREKTEHDTLQRELQEALSGDVDVLRKDPERLLRLMREVGPGRAP